MKGKKPVKENAQKNLKKCNFSIWIFYKLVILHDFSKFNLFKMQFFYKILQISKKR